MVATMASLAVTMSVVAPAEAAVLTKLVRKLVLAPTENLVPFHSAFGSHTEATEYGTCSMIEKIGGWKKVRPFLLS